MGIMRSVLKEYLVKIKMEVDKEAQRKAMAEVDTSQGKLVNMAKIAGTSFVKAGAMVTSALISINSLILKTVDSVSDADIEAGRFARKMWTTKENAQALLTTFDAIGSSWEDLFYMTDEEFQRFLELKKTAQSLQPPEDLEDTLLTVRDIGMEVDRLQIIFEYAKKWFVAAFGAYAKEDLQELRDGFKSLNEYLIQKLPSITDKLGKFAYIVFRLGKTGVILITRLSKALFDLFDKLPSSVKVAGGAITGFLALLKMGPVGMAIAAILALLLLLDDFYTWQKGGKSLLGDMWQKMADATEDENSGLSKAINLAKELYSLFESIVGIIWDAIQDTIQWATESGFVERTINNIEGTFKSIVAFLDEIVAIIQAIVGFSQGLGDLLTGKKSWSDTWSNMKEWASNFGKRTSDNFWDMILPMFGTSKEELFGDTDRPTREEWETYKSAFPGVDWNREAYNSYMSGNTTNSQTNSQTNYITVQGQGYSYAPRETAQAVVDAIKSNRDFFTPLR